MKAILFGLVISLCCLFTSCESVPSGYRGVEVSYGGKVNMEQTYSEGFYFGYKWLFDDLVAYNVKEQTLVEKFEFNDKDNLITTVELSLDYRNAPDKVNKLHATIDDRDIKILKTLKSAGKEIIPSYSAIELNVSKRTEAEERLSKIIAKELPEFYVDFVRLQLTDVDFPKSISELAEKNAIQLSNNELALKKEAEQVALAAANIAKAKGAADAEIARAKGEYEAAVFDAKTKDILSQPNMLKLKELEVEMTWAEKGVSKWGANNVFGSNATLLKEIN